MDKTILVEKVSDLFRVSGYRVKTSVRINHREIDIVAEEMQGLVRKTILVECADYVSPVGIPKLQEDLNKLRSAKELLSERAVMMHVARVGYSPDALGYAQSNGIDVLTVEELTQRLINFDAYVEATDHDALRPFILKEYQPTTLSFEGRKQSASPAIEFLKNWVDSGTRWLTILGDYGVGKSWMLKRFLYYLMGEFKRDPLRNPLPLFIPLQRFTKAFDFTNLVLATFQLHGISGIPYSAFEYLASAGRVVFLLDSFDEMAQTLARGTIRTNLNELLIGIRGNSRAIMTSRPTYFDSRAERLLVVEREGQLEWHAQDREENVRQTALSRMLDKELNSVQFARLGDLTTKQRKQLFKIVLDDKPNALRKLNELYDRFQELENISQKAVIARLLTTVAMTLAAGQEVKTPDGYPLIPDDLVKLNQGKIFEIVTNNLLDRDRLVGDLRASERLRFLRSLAVHLQQPGSDFFANPTEIRELVRNQFETLIRATDAPQQQLENYYRTCRRHSGLTTERQFRDTSGNIDIPVDEHDTDSRVGFSHNSLREYLASDAIVDHVLNGSVYSHIETVVVTDLVGGFVSDASEYHPNLLSIIQQKFELSDFSNELLFRIICRLIDISSDHCRLLGSPARLRYADICNLDLSEIDLRRAEILGCIAADTDFRKTDLRQTCFPKTILQRVLFDGAKLDGADFKQADVQSIYVYDDFGRRTTAVLEGRDARQWLFSHGAEVYPSNDLNHLLGDESYEAAREVMLTLNKRIAGTHDEKGLEGIS